MRPLYKWMVDAKATVQVGGIDAKAAVDLLPSLRLPLQHQAITYAY